MLGITGSGKGDVCVSQQTGELISDTAPILRRRLKVRLSYRRVGQGYFKGSLV